jgi:tetrathionate reductase subunit B
MALFERPKKEKNYAMVIVQDRCVDCKACEVACKAMWEVPDGKLNYRTKVLDIDKVENGERKMVFIPILCNQCDNPPCVRVCPTSASYKRKSDGIVLVTPNMCIGCKTCMEACPYDARYYNEELGAVDKCTFCLPRLESGLEPACVQTCVGGSRNFGDLNDPNSIVSKLLKEATNYWVLKPEDGTFPNDFYISNSAKVE